MRQRNSLFSARPAGNYHFEVRILKNIETTLQIAIAGSLKEKVIKQLSKQLLLKKQNQTCDFFAFTATANAFINGKIVAYKSDNYVHSDLDIKYSISKYQPAELILDPAHRALVIFATKSKEEQSNLLKKYPSISKAHDLLFLKEHSCFNCLFDLKSLKKKHRYKVEKEIKRISEEQANKFISIKITEIQNEANNFNNYNDIRRTSYIY